MVVGGSSGLWGCDAKHGLIVVAKVVDGEVRAAGSGELEGGGGLDGGSLGRGDVGVCVEVVALVCEGVDAAGEVVVRRLGGDVGAGGLDAADRDRGWRRGWRGGWGGRHGGAGGEGRAAWRRWEVGGGRYLGVGRRWGGEERDV